MNNTPLPFKKAILAFNNCRKD